VVSAFFVWLQVRIMREQTRLQQKTAEDAQQPYVWADVRVDQGWYFELVIGNTGPSVATNVQVDISPPLPELPGDYQMPAVQSHLRKGLASLGPGRSWAWHIGPTNELVGQDVAYVVTINAGGPHGPVKTGPFVINMHHFSEAQIYDPGTLKRVAEAVEKGFKRMPGWKPYEPLHISAKVVPQSEDED
jgi:hypothetical protein